MIKELFLKYPKKKFFLLALSGGIDSIVLLFQLLKWKKKYNKKIIVRAIHINHQSNARSKKAEKYCHSICQKNNIPLIIANIPKQKKYQNGFENYARTERYKIFKKFLLKNEILLTAHHLNDQCENIFLALKRRRGISGISGMNFSNLMADMLIVRPFINHTKEKIILWAKKKKLTWIEDQSNQETKHDRNFIRHKILSKIYKRWPYFLKNCTNSMRILSGEQEMLNNFLQKSLLDNMFIDGRLYLLNFQKMLNHHQYSLLKLWILKQSKIFPNFKILKRIFQQLLTSNNTNNKKIIFYKYEIYRYHMSMYCILKNESVKNNLQIWKNILLPIKLPKNLGFLVGLKNKNYGNKVPCPKKNQIISIQFQEKKKSNKKKIKNLWQKYNIPPWYRHKIPLLFYNNTLICALGVFILNYKNIKKKDYINISWIFPI